MPMTRKASEYQVRTERSLVRRTSSARVAAVMAPSPRSSGRG